MPVHTDAIRRISPAWARSQSATAVWVSGRRSPVPPGMTSVSSAGASARVVCGLMVSPESVVNRPDLTPRTIVS
jgi:hypothetical protein